MTTIVPVTVRFEFLDRANVSRKKVRSCKHFNVVSIANTDTLANPKFKPRWVWLIVSISPRNTEQYVVDVKPTKPGIKVYRAYSDWTGSDNESPRTVTKSVVVNKWERKRVLALWFWRK